MEGWVEIGFLVFFALVLYAIARQIEGIAKALDRIEARLTLIKPMPEELDDIEDVEYRANPACSKSNLPDDDVFSEEDKT